MLVCNRCGKENQEHYKFCLGCGSDLSAVRNHAPVAPPPAAPVVAEPGPRADSEPSALRTDHQPAAPVDAITGHPPAPLAPPFAVVAASTAPSTAPSAAPEVLPVAGAGSGPVGAPTRSCPSCGKPVPWEFVFCGSCGTRLGAMAPPGGSHTVGSAAVPAPTPAARGKLILIRPDGGEGGSMQLSDGETLVGRNEGELFESDSYLSPKHAWFIFRGANLLVRDAGSLNGVFVKMSGEEELADGEVFRLGQELLRFDVIRPVAPMEDGTEVMGSPNPGDWGRLSVILGRGQDGAAFPLFGDSMIVGRERGDILFPEDGYVSGTHARISRRDGRYYLADLNSSNGSFLRIRGERTLRTGTFLLLGQQLFRVQYI